MTAHFYFPSREERKAIASGELVLGPDGPLAVAGSQSGVRCSPAAAGTPQQELPLPPSSEQPGGILSHTGRRQGENPPVAPVPVRAMEDMLAERMRAILDFGHTPEKDLQLPLAWLPQEARNYLIDALDELKRGPDRRAIARRKMIKAGAILFAAVDRLDAEPENDREDH